jgi:hypothetical protein
LILKCARTPLHHFGFARAQQAVVDENAGELVADGLVQQRRRHARIHAAAQAENDVFLADLRADFLDGLVDVIAASSSSAAAADAVDKVGDDFLAARRVDDFGMKLQAEEFPRAIFDRRVFGIFRDGDGLKPSGIFVSLSPWNSRPAATWAVWRTARRSVFHRERAFAVFALLAFLDFAAEKLREQLHAVADAQHRHAELKNVLSGSGASLA